MTKKGKKHKNISESLTKLTIIHKMWELMVYSFCHRSELDCHYDRTAFAEHHTQGKYSALHNQEDFIAFFTLKLPGKRATNKALATNATAANKENKCFC
jgi:hypothetical protein